MELNVQERLTLVNTLPEKGTFATMKTIEAMKTSLYPNEEETKKFEIKQIGKSISWNEEGGKGVEIKLTKVQKDLLIEALKKLDESEEATLSHFQVYEKLTANPKLNQRAGKK